MDILSNRPCAAFENTDLITDGLFLEVLKALKKYDIKDLRNHMRIFDLQSGREIEIDWRGNLPDIIKKYEDKFANPSDVSEDPPGPGRPKMGVLAKPVTLLPRHWEWLSRQPSGASAAIRKLLDAAMAKSDSGLNKEQIQESTYKLMQAIAGDLTHYEEALRALYKSDQELFELLISKWPKGLQKIIKQMAKPVFTN